ncbi:acyl-CoA dehydrogenase family protein [Muricoccus aerilatus]|uniref:acyl-CoA dehydrogenase family protein n=1 Tax=Muricoccus aerilatus TaxID=452982 RepID=UPI0005C1B885|nr:acyl-CoA dehydrogenase family protein [Roseomonas aerilata]
MSTREEAAKLIEAARHLGPTIMGMRDEIERERRLPAPLFEQLRDLGFFSLLLPRSFGGLELSLTDYIKVVEAVSRLDSSVGWCVTIGGGAPAWLSGFLPEAVARRIFVEDRSLVSGALGPIGRAVPVPGGYRMTGHWPFGSGIMHSVWTASGCVVMDGDAPRRKADGAPDTRILFAPTTAVEIIDTWYVSGLRGTGSHDYRVTDVFVPESHAIALGQDPVVPGPLYALPPPTVFGTTIAAVPLGIARAALDTVRQMSAGKTPRIGAALLRDRPVVQAAIGRAEAQLRAARAFLFEACEEACSATSNGMPVTLEQRAAVRLALAQAGEAAKGVVQIAYDIGGGTSVYDSCPLQRCFRDVHTASQHLQVQGVGFETAGRVLLGLEPGTPVL